MIIRMLNSHNLIYHLNTCSIVIVSSKLHEKGVLDWETIKGEKSIPKNQGSNVGYCNSKLANVLFGLKLAEKTKVNTLIWKTKISFFCASFRILE